MSRQRSGPIAHDTWEEGKRHRELVARKYERIRGLESLINTHERASEPDYVYIHKLKSKLHSVRVQLKAMAGSERE
jgi:hypothetical protein